jgi:head-tail adaptor
MTWLVTDLKQKIQIGTGLQVPNSKGGFSFSFNSIVRVWAAVTPISDYIKAVRGVNAQAGATHTFRIRRAGVRSLGREFAIAFGQSYKVNADLAPVKANWFVQMEQGNYSQTRLFEIIGVGRDDNFYEYIDLQVKEIMEQGSGLPPF